MDIMIFAFHPCFLSGCRLSEYMNIESLIFNPLLVDKDGPLLLLDSTHNTWDRHQNPDIIK